MMLNILSHVQICIVIQLFLHKTALKNFKCAKPLSMCSEPNQKLLSQLNLVRTETKKKPCFWGKISASRQHVNFLRCLSFFNQENWFWLSLFVCLRPLNTHKGVASEKYSHVFQFKIYYSYTIDLILT